MKISIEVNEMDNEGKGKFELGYQVGGEIIHLSRPLNAKYFDLFWKMYKLVLSYTWGDDIDTARWHVNELAKQFNISQKDK